MSSPQPAYWPAGIDTQHLRRAAKLPNNATDKVGGIAGFFDTSDNHEALVTRPRDLLGGATPSGSAMAVGVAIVQTKTNGE